MLDVTKKLKNILLVSGFIMLILLLIGDLYFLKKYFPNKNFSKNIYVLNDTKYDVELKTKIILNKIFKYDSMYVKYVYLNEELLFGNMKISAFIVKNPMFNNQYLIYMSKDIKSYHEDIIISHELLHLKQYENCDLELINPFIGLYKYFNDTLNLNYIPYNKRPFEIDAYNSEDTIYQQLQILLKKYRK